jgi:hypothetical protein
MRERAARITSRLLIESRVRGGAHVELSVPASMAYAGFDTKSSLWTRFMARWARRKSQDE